MKVVAFNGSPNKSGNTYSAIKVVTDELEKEGIEIEIIHIGNEAINGCMACDGCARNQDQKCVQTKDNVNEWIDKMAKADGIILGSPVYFSGITGNMKSFLDRAFYVSTVNGGMFRNKVGASVAVGRRSGAVSSFHQLNNFFSYAEMIMPTANSWNTIYGKNPGEVLEDEEGVQVMSMIGKRMAWLMKLTKNMPEGIEAPKPEAKIFTNFFGK